jgi:hypothetical protein
MAATMKLTASSRRIPVNHQLHATYRESTRIGDVEACNAALLDSYAARNSIRRSLFAVVPPPRAMTFSTTSSRTRYQYDEGAEVFDKKR